MPGKVSEFLDRKIIILKDTTPIYVAARTMKEQRTGCIIVYGDDGVLKGIVSDRDIVCETVANQFPLDAAVSSAMTYGVFSVDEKADVSTVLDIMETYGVRRVPVITSTPNGREKCVGIVTLDDLIAAQRVSPKLLSRIVKRQIQRRNLSSSNERKREIQNDDHREQTLSRFYKVLAEKCLTSHADTLNVSKILFSLLIERLPASGAARLIAQMPRLLQEDLLDLPAGPNKRLTSVDFIQSMVFYFKTDERRALEIVCGFWKAILSFLKTDNLDFVLLLLPRDIQDVLHGVSTKKYADIDVRKDKVGDDFDEVTL